MNENKYTRHLKTYGIQIEQCPGETYSCKELYLRRKILKNQILNFKTLENEIQTKFKASRRKKNNIQGRNKYEIENRKIIDKISKISGSLNI